jgi:hypothetical protein
VLRLAERASTERLERACVRALHHDTPDYPTLSASWLPGWRWCRCVWPSHRLPHRGT